MSSPFESLGVWGVVGIVGALGAIGIVGATGSFWFRTRWRATTDRQDLPYRPVATDSENGSPVTAREPSNAITEESEIERLKASLEELLSALKAEVSCLHRLLEKKPTVLSPVEEADPGKIHEIERKITLQDQRLQEQDARLSSVEGDLARLKSEIGKTKTDNERTVLSPTIVNKADSLSVAEVADLVKILNAQIEQVTSLITESLSTQESTSTGKEQEIVWDKLNDYIGSWLWNNLNRRSTELIMEQDPLIMQLILQTGLVNACSRIINDWDPPFWIDGWLFSHNDTYSNIKKTNGQATADGWKALSQTHMTASQRQEANKNYLTDVLLKLITAVGGSQEGGRILLSQYNEKVEDIVQKAVGLHKTVNEDVISMELVTYISQSDTSFDASQMEGTEGMNESRSDTVVCTVDMGLRCRKRDKLEEKNRSKDEWGVAMKSKVVLAATLES